ncbi:MAG: PQQ-dependent sugar dehydrogenase [Ignavibacteriae bacterium]|nr:PQQ-dependent sugar dehydrogenase [Ignavibacteriota bacterium]MCB9217460.1 PQQ-dependent sugar dehydrogenase [Ignavibacteria bacterium]
MPTLLRRFIVLLPLLLPTLLQAQSVYLDIVEAFPKISTSFNEVTDIQNAGDGSNRLFVSRRTGEIYVFDNNPEVTESKLFLDLTGVVTTDYYESGLLGFTLHPNFSENGYIFVYYMVRRGLYFYTRISRFTHNPASSEPIDLATEVNLFDFRQPAIHHNGGQVGFGPDGYLYIALGDGVDPDDPLNSGQDLRSILGKILRVDIDNPANGKNYGIPETNPFARNSQYAQEIYAWGFRNPWRFSFDQPTGRLWVGDVGQFNWEEVNLVQKGGNYGWRVMEGYHCHDSTQNCDSIGLIGPIWEYSHDTNTQSSITGGYVYRGTNIPELDGMYFYTDFSTGRIWMLDYQGKDDVTNTLVKDSELVISTFGVDEGGEIYIGNYVDGKLYKFARHLGGVAEEGSENVQAILHPALPNPARDRVTIPYSINRRALVSLALFDTQGNRVEQMLEKVQEKGEHRSEVDVSELPDGTYYIQLIVGSTQVARKITVVN